MNIFIPNDLLRPEPTGDQADDVADYLLASELARRRLKAQLIRGFCPALPYAKIKTLFEWFWPGRHSGPIPRSASHFLSRRALRIELSAGLLTYLKLESERDRRYLNIDPQSMIAAFDLVRHWNKMQPNEPSEKGLMPLFFTVRDYKNKLIEIVRCRECDAPFLFHKPSMRVHNCPFCEFRRLSPTSADEAAARQRAAARADREAERADVPVPKSRAKVRPKAQAVVGGIN